MAEKPLILWLDQDVVEDLNLIGGKALGLARLVKHGIPVPPAFVVTSEAYIRFTTETGISDFIKNVIEKEIRSGRPEEYERASEIIRAKFIRTPLPQSLRKLIVDAYNELASKVGLDNPRVAVRSSATVEDSPEASFAGQQETYLNIKGADEVVEHVKKAWASLWTARAMSYRDSLNIDHQTAYMAVIVQKMVNSRSSGVMFTLHPVTGDTDKIVIESIWGLGEYIVGGKVTPDSFVVSKNSLDVIEERISVKERGLFYEDTINSNVEIVIPKNLEDIEDLRDKYPSVYKFLKRHEIIASKPSLNNYEVRKLANIALKIEELFKHSMDIEWAIDGDIDEDNIFIVQARPETVWSKRKEIREEVAEKGYQTGDIILQGIAASPGIASGKVKVALTVEEARNKMEKGDILVTKMTDPDWVPYMKMASAIVTDEGGVTAHAAIVARELGIPAVVGTGNATEKLTDNMEVTVDGTRGVIYYGIIEDAGEKEEERTISPGIPAEMLIELYPVTATKIYMNLGEPDQIDKYKNLPFDGIGLMRIEFIISDWIGYHPLYLIEQGRGVYFVDRLAEGIAKVARAIYPRPVVVRFSDFKTNEYRRLKGGEKYEMNERNPMIGWRGVSRYISPMYEQAFRLEVRAIRKVREELKLNNVWVMFPFVRTTWELEKAIRIMEDEGLYRSRDFKVWIMVEVPSTVLLADEFAKLIDGFSIGSNDLTQLVLGVDRDSATLTKMGYFDERDPAVIRAIDMIIDAAKRNGITSSICGQAPSIYPEIVEHLVRKGIDSISVNPDAVISVRRQVASIEKRIILEKLRDT